MSLILEALRKSEAERRRAQAPDLFAPAQVAVAPARRLPPAWLLVGGVLGLMLVAWLLVRAFGTAPEQSGPANAGAATAAQPPAATVPAPAGVAVPTNTAPRLLPAAEEPPAAAVDVPPPGTVPQSGSAETGIATGAANAAGGRMPAPEPAAPLPAASAAPVAPATEPAPAPAPDTATPTRLSELGGEARRQLPPLKLTMHMWNEAAERRFVILDGRRLAEGDRIGTVQVAEIRRDGVILDWNGQRLELPLR